MMENFSVSDMNSEAASDITAQLNSIQHATNIEHAMAYLRAEHDSTRYASTRYLLPEFEPAYRYGVAAFLQEPDKHRTFASAATELSSGWLAARGASRLAWRHARYAVEAAWRRVQCTTHSDDVSLENRGETD